MLQARYEWTALVDCYINRLSTYERSFEILDDAMLTRTTELTAAVATLRQFTNLLASTIKTCKNFQSDYISLFDVGSVKLMDWWQGYITSFGDSILELEMLHMIMSQKLELFNSMLDGLVSASSLSESTQATRQADNIGILTKMTVFYLPLSLATTLFSVVMLPKSNWLWLGYGFILCLATIATLFVARHPHILDGLFQVGQEKANWNRAAYSNGGKVPRRGS